MNVLWRFFRSSIGKKILMACTGLVLVLFLIVHLLGNLQMFQGQEAMNHYAEFLHSKPALVWGSRIVLLAIFIVHVAVAIDLSLGNKAARPVPYKGGVTNQVSSVASRYMLLTGLLVLFYLLYHLLHFTVPVVMADAGHSMETLADGAQRKDAYRMVVLGFQNPAVSLSYIAAMIVLGFHLYHAIASFFQTIGFNHESYNACFKRIAIILSVLICGGFLSIPVSVWAGIIDLP